MLLSLQLPPLFLLPPLAQSCHRLTTTGAPQERSSAPEDRLDLAHRASIRHREVALCRVGNYDEPTTLSFSPMPEI
ncbi:hypothetical protein GWI33_005319 [Rhynchophorus ferrugineus]|uniref:Secreted protein n=1 Tax=Rhynchophorus ferrugineus TaxID=354439 RepID=A0A834IWN4_RHYFE|nr:hypothetical protein GWI33_005319 [Rhynchophorus ferrugineus]